MAWWRRFGSLLREQWIFAALLGFVWAGDLMVMLAHTHHDAAELAPGMTAMVLLALVGRWYPTRCSLLACAALLGNTAVFAVTDADIHSIHLGLILMTENAAGTLLVLYAFRARPLHKAIPAATALVLSCLTSIAVRVMTTSYLDPTLDQAVALGFLELVLAVGTGLYLRGDWPGRSQHEDSPTRALLRRQWPIMAALSVLLFLEFLRIQDLDVLSLLVVLTSSMVMAAIATLAPMRPTESVYLGAATVLLTVVVMQVLGLNGPRSGLMGPISLVTVGAGMLLVTYVFRHVELRRAIRSTAVLVVVTLVAVFMTPDSLHDSVLDWRLSSAVPVVFMGGLLLVISVGTGMYFRARDEERTRSVHAAVESAQHAERMALARELHDVVAHHVTGIVVQAQAAQMVVEQNPKAATEALARISDSGTEALTAMRRLVASMRGSEPAGASAATEQATTDLEADLRALVESARRRSAGHTAAPRVDLRVDLVDRPVPQEVARSALRVVQESLTNSEKHATDASCVQVAVWADHTNLYTVITDDGSGVQHQPVGGSGGYGLVGMRERIELLGGEFRAGPGEHVGWRVEAVLPLEEQSAEEGQR